MSKYLTLDCETKDPYISAGLGSGAVFAINGVNTLGYKVLGFSVKEDNNPSRYIDLTEPESYNFAVEDIKSYIEDAEILVMHNASYDLSALKVIGIDVKDMPIIDSLIAAKLFNSSLNSYALDFLGEKYLKIKKDNVGLSQAALDANLYPWSKTQLLEKDRAFKCGGEYVRHISDKPVPLKTLKSFDETIKYGGILGKDVEKFCKSNMDILQNGCYKAVEHYACRDTDLTYQLLMYLIGESEQKDFVDLCLKYSFPIYPAMAAREKGMRIDLNAARESFRDMQPIIEEAYRDVYEMAGEEFNLKSNKDVPRIFDKLGIMYPKTPKGNPSIRAPWLEDQGHKICKAIVKARKYTNISNNFIKKLITMQTYTLGLSEEEVAHMDYGRVFPEWKIFGAKTGRMSCTNPNTMQIPKRDKVMGPICRKMFVPEEGEIFFAPDFSNQEGRIQVHYAYLLGCEGVVKYRDAFLNDAKFDTHQMVADIMGVDRDTAKIIYLAKAYGAGGAKICDQLGLPTEFWTPEGTDKKIRVAGMEGKNLIAEFNNAIPFLLGLAKACEQSLMAKGYIKTIGGRRMTPICGMVDGQWKQFYYKALNQLAQGSGADQTMAAMVMAHKAGLTLTGFVHDELLLSGTQEQGEQLKEIMETCIELEVPSFVELGQGKNWSEAH